MKVKPFDNPENNFMILHNAIFDSVMRECTPSEWKVLCAILRKTRGWQRDSDYISYSQIRDMTGIASSGTIKAAVDGLADKRMILMKSGDFNTPNSYRLNRAYVTITESVIPPITEIEQPPITESVNTKDTIKDINNMGGEAPPEFALLDYFRDITGLDMPPAPHEQIYWIREADKWLKAGATTADIADAVKESDKRGTTLAKPSGITSYLKSAIARRKRGAPEPESDKQTFTRTPRTPAELAAHNQAVLDQLAEEY